MLPETKCSLSKCSPSKCSPKKALQSNPRQPKLIDAPDLPTVVNGFETILRIYLSSTLLTHEFFLGSIFFGEHFDGEHFDREHFVSESIFWRAFYREHLAGSICLESIWPRIMYTSFVEIPHKKGRTQLKEKKVALAQMIISVYQNLNYSST